MKTCPSATGTYKCFNSLANVFDDNNGARRQIFDPSIGAFRPRADGNAGVAETPSNDPRQQASDVIPETERLSLFATADYNLGFAEFFGDFLYTNRQTEQTSFRQFFPWVGPTDPTNPTPVAFSRPITLVPFNTDVDIDYYSATAGLRGDFGNSGFLQDWTWETSAVYSYSDADYNRDTIPLNRVVDPIRGGGAINVPDGNGGFSCQYIEDQDFAENGLGGTYVPCPVDINYFTRDFIFGNFTSAQEDFLFETDSGTTTYEQLTLSGVVTGSVFELPAGDVGVALGVEYRDYELEDTPGFFSANNNQWGLSSAGVTAGSDNVMEAFGEVEVPILAGLPFAEELSLNFSGRIFEYDSYGSDSVYKAGLNYQITPSVRVRGTYGTSYRTPALYELFLGDQTSFLGQLEIDPCNFSDGGPQNPNIRQNCLTQVPNDYVPFGSSAQITTGGGADVLEAETSDAFTAGAIYTPTWSNLSIAVDYFEIEVNDQIAQLGSGSIVSGCYASPNFPNDPLCSLFERDLDPNSPTFQQILTVNDSYVNINSQTTRGLDLTTRYEHEFDFGDLIFDLQGTWTFEDSFLLFGGTDFDVDEDNGEIGQPDFTANSRIQFVTGDWTLNWFTDFVSRTSNDAVNGGSLFTYRGRPDTYYKQFTEPYFEHGASVQYRADDWRLTLGVSNIFDEQFPYVSSGAATRRGNTPLVGTQYSYRGRAAFARLQKQF
ncbi:TonB-dependent receptor [Henriciella sp.]|uniref:TonB-dependent receptor domain-containing protein n=1 Tax=Henriciella sp. TaxID=1968823 RepID=UPI00262F190D|nr:TonB-dependent receptor [Henriciella sp.]